MSYTAEQLLSLANSFQEVTSDSLVKEAKKKEEVKGKKKFFPFWLKNKKTDSSKDSKDSNSAKDKSSKKVDPKAEVRNRGTVCVPAESAKDKKDHFPINNENQARNALAQVNKFTNAPEWYHGSLQSLVSLVAKKVKAKYPSIEVSKDAKTPGKKKASAYYSDILNKYGQMRPQQLGGSGSEEMVTVDKLPAGTLEEVQSIMQLLEQSGTPSSKANANNLRFFTDPTRSFNLTYLSNALLNAAKSLNADKDYAGQSKAQTLYKKLLWSKSNEVTTPGGNAPGDGAGRGGFGGAGVGSGDGSGKAKPKGGDYPSINPDTQTQLNALGYSVPLNPDGKLGPATAKGIKWFRDNFKEQVPELTSISNLSDVQVATMVNNYYDKIYGANPAAGPSVKEQFDAGTLKTIDPPTTAADLENEFFKKLGA